MELIWSQVLSQNLEQADPTVYDIINKVRCLSVMLWSEPPY